MSALTLDSVVIPVAPEGHSQTWEALGSMSRSHAGYMRSAVTATFGRARVWRIETPSMSASDADTLETLLEALGTLEADGYLVDDTATDVFVQGLERRVDREANTVSLSFELHEASP